MEYFISIAIFIRYIYSTSALVQVIIKCFINLQINSAYLKNYIPLLKTLINHILYTLMRCNYIQTSDPTTRKPWLHKNFTLGFGNIITNLRIFFKIIVRTSSMYVGGHFGWAKISLYMNETWMGSPLMRGLCTGPRPRYTIGSKFIQPTLHMEFIDKMPSFVTLCDNNTTEA